MGCGKHNSVKSLPVIVRKSEDGRGIDGGPLNPHAEDEEAEIIEHGRVDNKKAVENLGDDAITENKSSKIVASEPGLSQTVNVVMTNEISVENPTNLTVNQSVKPREKVDFPVHEHVFYFNFLDEEKKHQEHNHDVGVDEVFEELSKI